MDTGGYKSFSNYTKGLANLSKLVEYVLPSFRIRLFIDNTIYSDKQIMDLIKKIHNIDCVLYHCPNFIEMKGNETFHLGIFGTLVRYFPMFDFQNNDAGDVIVYDIDVKSDNLEDNIEDNTEYHRINGYNIVKSIYSKLDNIYLYINSRLFHNNLKNKFIYKEQFIVPYVIASKIINFKKMPNKILVDFMNNIHETKIRYTNYIITKEIESRKCSKYICFGLDEYFINEIVVKNLLDNKLPILIKYTFHILQPFFFYNKTSQTIPKFNKCIKFLLTGVKYSGNPINFIDKLFYDDENNARQKLSEDAFKIAHNYYKLIQLLFIKKDFDIVNKDFIMLCLSRNVYGNVYFDKYLPYFCKGIKSKIEKQIKLTDIAPINPTLSNNELIRQILS